MTARALALQLSFALCLGFSATQAWADLTSAFRACETVAMEDSVFTISDCPGLADAIESSIWEEVLAPGWSENLSYLEVMQLLSFDSYYRPSNPSVDQISLSSLDDIVTNLNQPAASQPVSLWGQFVTWLRGLLTKETGDSSGWFSEWLENFHVPVLTLKIIFWVLAGIIIVAAIAIVIIEVRAARVSRLPGANRQKKDGGQDDLHPVASPLSLEDLDGALAHEKPSILLRLLSQRLERCGLASYRPALTHRELSRSARGLRDDEVETLSRVSDSAERVRFSGTRPLPEEISRVVSAGLALLGKLNAGQV